MWTTLDYLVLALDIMAFVAWFILPRIPRH